MCPSSYFNGFLVYSFCSTLSRQGIALQHFGSTEADFGNSQPISYCSESENSLQNSWLADCANEGWVGERGGSSVGQRNNILIHFCPIQDCLPLISHFVCIKFRTKYQNAPPYVHGSISTLRVHMIRVPFLFDRKT